MALPLYGVLVGTITGKLNSPEAKKKSPGGSPHFQILVEAKGIKYRIAINVKSDQKPPDLQFYLDDNYDHPVLSEIKALSPGYTKLESKPGTAALDFIRENLFDMSQMRVVPAVDSNSENDLNDIFDVHVKQAINTPGALVYAFGSKWGPENDKKDEYFDFLPGNGIHDIHFNQGNEGAHAKDNGVYQDGALLLYFPDENRWVAMFTKFQSQVIHTGDTNGTPGKLPAQEEVVKIFAALINPKGVDPGKETVYLLNTTTADIDLNGWMIADKLKHKEKISGITLNAGQTIMIRLSGKSAQLSNEGGIITLLDKNGTKISGVSYTKADASAQGTVVKF